MEELETTLMDLKSVLESIPTIRFVSHGKPTTLTIDDKMPSIYIVPTNEAFVNTKNTTCITGYDNYVYVKLIVNMECVYDLEWVSLRSSIIDAVLKDTDIWRSVIDREVAEVAHDDYDNYPKKSFQVAFEFRLRAQ